MFPIYLLKTFTHKYYTILKYYAKIIMKISNFNNFYPNVLHFHGQNKSQLPRTFDMIFNEHQVNTNYDKSKLAIISTWTSNEDCCLYQQCKKYNI